MEKICAVQMIPDLQLCNRMTGNRHDLQFVIDGPDGRNGPDRQKRETRSGRENAK